MSNLENLTAKIKADGQLKAKTILDNAENDKRKLLADTEAEASAESRRLLAATEEESKRIVDLALSAKRVETRDRLLAAKRQTIERAFSAANQKLTAIDKDAYESFLSRYLTDMNLTPGECLRVPQAYAAVIDMDALNGKLTAAGKPTVTLDKQAYTADGFKLVKDDIENDNSFDALIDYYRATLEQMVVEALFNG